MANAPDFYLTTAGEYRPLTPPRACVAVRRLRDETRDDYMLVEVEPALCGAECGISAQESVRELVLASKWRGMTLFPIHHWPMPVYVMLPLNRDIHNAAAFGPDEVRMIAWGTLHQTLKDATDAAREFL